MPTDADEAIDHFYQQQSRTVPGQSTPLGIASKWTAPVAIFDATNGFGEEAWISAIPTTVLATRLRGESVTWCTGRKAGAVSGKTPATVLQPRGTPNDSFAKGPVRFAQIYLRDSFIDQVADAIIPGAAVSGKLRDDLVFVRDREFERRIAAYLDASTTHVSLLELEASAIVLVSHLLRAFHGFARPGAATGGLSPWQLKRACDAMEDRLSDEVGLDAISGLVGLSATHFSRAFKQATGMPPFRWLMERRIERAKSLIEDGQIPLAQIALSVGFAAQPQFTTAFKRVAGITPGVWRRGRL